MSRNQNTRFAYNPSADIKRSRFKRNSEYKTSFNVGELIPFYCDEVLPGDTFQIRTNKVVRMQPLVSSPMDNLYLDTYYFFVPNRIVWEHWQQFMGENTQSAWIPSTEYEIPVLDAPTNGWSTGTIADYFGIPIGVDNFDVNALPFRAYAKICDEFFRDENLQQPLNIPVDDTTVVGVNTDNQVTDIAKGGKPFKVCKYHDYFTSALPYPQKSADVLIPTGTASGSSELPVYGNGKGLLMSVFANPNDTASQYPHKFYYPTITTNDNGSYYFTQRRCLSPVVLGDSPSNVFTPHNIGDKTTLSNAASLGPYIYGSTSSDANNAYVAGVASKNALGDNLSNSGLVADASGMVTVGATINQLRTAFQIQKLYERDARGGTRYIELLQSHFGVTSPDARLQRPEYLGGNRLPINVNSVIQTSNSGSGITPQGNVAGYSITSDSHGDFIKSFTEHGYVIGVMCARYDHTYSQGLERHWSRRERFDYYFPVLENLGEQAIKNKEIYIQGDDIVNPDTGKAYDDEVFGYQEAWAEYRYKPSICTSEMRPNSALALSSWHFGDKYNSLPLLSSSWIVEDKSNVDRTLAVSSSVANQLFADIYIENETTRPMGMYSIPGLIDHN